MRRILFSILTMAVVLSLVVIGCAAPTAPAAAPSDAAAEPTAAPAEAEAGAGDKIELHAAWWGSQDRADRTIKAIELFESMHPEIDIVYEFSGWDDHWVKMATQAAGGNLPDIMQQDYARLEEWVSRDSLLPLDEFLADGTIDMTNITEAAIAGGRIDGKLYGINLGTNSQVIAIDTDAFAQAGMELPNQEWTWAEFEQTVLALHEKLGIWGIGPGVSNEQQWKSLYLSHGEWGYNDEGTGLGYTDDSIFANHLAMLLRLQEAGAIPTREEEVARWTGTGVEALPIVTKESAMDYFHSNQIVAVQTAAGDDRNIVLFPLPRLEGGQSGNYLKPSQFFSITSGSQHPKEAAMFIDFITNDIAANEILFAERGVPISSEVRAALDAKLGKAQKEMFDYIARIEPSVSPIPPPDPPGHADVITNIYWPEVVNQVLYGQMSPEDGVALWRTLAEPVLAKAAGQ